MKQDIEYMCRALDLARQAIGRTSPNPMVGAVIVRDGLIVGEGYHQQAGTPHAEIHAIMAAGEKAHGATLYVTLEPCSHYGRTGPCAEAVINAGIKKVVVAMTDPNPQVAGRGLTLLRTAGIEVVEGVLAAEAAKLNEVFIKWISTGMPFGLMKTAMTLDGKIATRTGNSKWITGEISRERVHLLRDNCDAIMVGIGTVLADDPQLTTRLPQGGKNPLRVIVDSFARTPLSAKVLTDGQAPTIIAATCDAPTHNVLALRAIGAEVLIMPRSENGVDLRILFDQLAKRNITSVLIEGGAAINAAALTANIVDKIYAFVAPKIIGGNAAPGPVGGRGIEQIEAAIRLEEMNAVPSGEDILISGYLLGREGRDVYRTCGRVGKG
ncbi:MAG: riboflavin biosynthesis protein RibD [Firmicutes bacterium]|nr:riboflavin biosynthesis protein RibD [Bacillota bacterium]